MRKRDACEKFSEAKGNAYISIVAFRGANLKYWSNCDKFFKKLETWKFFTITGSKIFYYGKGYIIWDLDFCTWFHNSFDM